MEPTVSPVTIDVRCLGEKHRVTIKPCGTAVLHDHNIRDEKAVTRITKHPCPCLMVLLTWESIVTGDRQQIPLDTSLFNVGSLIQLATKKRDAVCAWRRKITTQPPDQMVGLFHYRAVSPKPAYRWRVTRTIARSMLCRVRHEKLRYAKGLKVLILEDNKIRFQNRLHTEQSTLHLSADWLDKVYKKGLAIHGGEFVVDVLPRETTRSYAGDWTTRPHLLRLAVLRYDPTTKQMAVVEKLTTAPRGTR